MQYERIHHVPGEINRQTLRSRHITTNILVYKNKENILKVFSQEAETGCLQ